MNLNSVIALIILQFASISVAAQLIERSGRFEMNWSVSKVRFYGTSNFEPSEDSMRPAEQRAWSEGLTFANQNLHQILDGNRGVDLPKNSANVSPITQWTTSVSTTYFGNNKLKVLLEVPMARLFLDQDSSSKSNSFHSDPSKSLVIRLPRGAKPTGIFRIVDESGLELITESQLVKSISGGADLPKWYRSQITSNDSAILHGAPVIEGVQVSPGTIKIRSDEWKNSFQTAFLEGAAGFLIQ